VKKEYISKCCGEEVEEEVAIERGGKIKILFTCLCCGESCDGIEIIERGAEYIKLRSSGGVN